MSETIKTLRPLLALLACALIFNFCYLVWETAVNLPIWDDFDSALFFVNRYQNATSVYDRLALILEQHNEHRILINRVLTLVSLMIFSTVHFTFMIYCAVAALLLLTALLCARTREPYLSLTFAAAIMLQPQYGDGLNWVTTCLASFTLCLLALICSRLAFANGRKYLWMFPLLAVAGFSQGNGILLPFCIALTLALHRRWKRAVTTIAGGGVIVGLYFQHYRFPAQGKGLSELLAHYQVILEYGFSLVGNAPGFSSPIASLVCGILLTILFLLLAFSPAAKRHPALVSFALFLFLSAAINTAARGISGVQYALSPGRYTILSSGIMATLGILLLERVRHVALRSLLLAAALTFNYFSWQHYRYAVNELNLRAINDLALHLLFGQGLTYPWPERGIPIFKESLANGTFNLEEVIDDLNLSQRALLPALPFPVKRKGLRTHVDRVQMGEEYIVIEGWGFFRNCPTAATVTYLRLANSNSELILKPRIKPRGDLLGLFKNPDRERAGYITMFPRSYLPSSDPYSIEVLFSCKEENARQVVPYSIAAGGVTRIEKGPDKAAN